MMVPADDKLLGPHAIAGGDQEESRSCWMDWLEMFAAD